MLLIASCFSKNQRGITFEKRVIFPASSLFAAALISLRKGGRSRPRGGGKKIGQLGVIVLDHVRYRLTHGPDETAEIIARRSVDRGQEK